MKKNLIDLAIKLILAALLVYVLTYNSHTDVQYIYAKF